MTTIENAAAVLSRIVVGYLVACMVAALGLFLMGAIMGIGEPLTEGRTALQDLANQAGYLPVFAVFAAVLAAPLALLAILISEALKIERLWFFLTMGALASIPALFMGDERSVAEMLRGFAMFAPIGAIAGATYWLIRHRKWPL